eukprot:TRINITY_DN1397_c0_g1_i4.p1 TRINITY_DN1397_c0_g1~~TRINITY_DN1397_c0_g1_i4.p1  ORF type:complete len:1144 (-),score=169.73 TRINITY_DN1397_c0_g1_i4:38-3469(-)
MSEPTLEARCAQAEAEVAKLRDTIAQIWEMYGITDPSTYSGDVISLLSEQSETQLQLSPRGRPDKPKPSMMRKFTTAGARKSPKRTVLPVKLESEESVASLIQKHSMFTLLSSDQDSSFGKVESTGYFQLQFSTKAHLIALICLPPESPLRELINYDKFISDFLTTFLVFITPSDLFQELTKRYEREPNSIDDRQYRVQAVILNFISKWLQVDGGDDFKDPALSKSLSTFLTKHSQGVFKDTLIHELSQEFTKLTQGAPLTAVTISLFPPLTPRTRSNTMLAKTDISIAFLDLERMATNLTILEVKLFLEIKRKEFLSNKWSGKRKETEAPNICKYIDHGNHITSWLKTEVLRFSSREARASLITKYIQLLSALEQRKNYNTLYQVLSCLHSSPISKLKNTWELVSKKDKEILAKYTKLMDNGAHYQAYYEALHSLPPETACVPLLSVICQELFMIEETQTTADPKGRINWNKMYATSQRIQELHRFVPGLSASLSSMEEDPNYRFLILNSEAWYNDGICFKIAALRDKTVEGDEATLAPYSKLDQLYNKGGLSEHNLTVLLSGSQVKTYAPGAIILEPGIPSDYMCFVASGEVSISIPTGVDDTTIGSYGKSDVFGFVGLLLPSHEVSKNIKEIIHEGEHCFDVNLEKRRLINTLLHPSTLDDFQFVLSSHCLQKPTTGQTYLFRFEERRFSICSLSSETYILHVQENLYFLPFSPPLDDFQFVLSSHCLQKPTSFVFKKSLDDFQSVLSSHCLQKPTSFMFKKIFISSTLDDFQFVLSSHCLQKPTTGQTYIAATHTVIHFIALPMIIQIAKTDHEFSYRLHLTLARNLAQLQRMILNCLLPSSSSATSEEGLKPSALKPESLDQTKGEERVKRVSAYYSKNHNLQDTKFSKLFKLTGEVPMLEVECHISMGKKKGSGVVYLSQRYFCFVVTSFGNKMREAWPFREITAVTPSKEGDVEFVSIQTPESTVILSKFSHKVQLFSAITGIWKTTNETTSSTTLQRVSQLKERVDPLNPTEEDWELLLKGASLTKYKKGKNIVTEGQSSCRLLKIVSGECNVVKEGLTKEIAVLQMEDVIGEVEIIEGSASQTSVTAVTTTTVQAVEAYFLNILFQHHPEIAGRFYHYISCLLASRLVSMNSLA